jgi:hypothetical protein
MKRDGPKVPTAVHGPTGITYYRNEKANAIANCLEKQFTSHDLCDENHERRVKTKVQGLLASVDDTPLGKVRSCEINKLANSLKLRKSCGLDDIPNVCLRHLSRRPLVHLTHCTQEGKLFEEVILKIVQRHTDERGLLNANHFGLRVVTARHFNIWGLRTTSH